MRLRATKALRNLAMVQARLPWVLVICFVAIAPVLTQEVGLEPGIPLLPNSKAQIDPEDVSPLPTPYEGSKGVLGNSMRCMSR